MAQPSSDLIAALGQVILTGPVASALPLEHTTVTAQVIGPYATVTVTQRFGNPLQEASELEYLFPLPQEGAVIDFELRCGSRRIHGDVQEIEQARQAYEDARVKGQRAGLLEQRRSNLFALRLANLLPGETIQSTLRYQQKIGFDDGAFEFVFPMGITPRYDRPEHPEEAEGVHAPIALSGEAIGTVEISVAVDAGVSIGEPVSPSHPVEVVRLDERRVQVRLAGEQIPNRDFVLRYTVESDQAVAGIWLSKRENEETFLALITPPALEEDYVPLRREFIFVLDRSGSMSQEPIQQARNALRACLRSLRAEDTFRILLFDDQLEWYREEPARVEQAEIDQADAFLAAVQSRGGTEILAALEAALAVPTDPSRMRFVVFLTDGAVSAEQAVLRSAVQHLGEARLFTFGIGSSVNRALLSRLAKTGKGTAEFLQLDEDIEGAIIRFQDRVTFPVLTDLSFEWHNARVWDVYPTRLPDLFSGQPVQICGKLQRTEPGPVNVWVRGKRNQTDVTLTVAVPETPAAEPALERIWAKERIEDLLEKDALMRGGDRQNRPEVIRLALEQRLITPYTAFIALDEDVANPQGKSQKIHVAQPLPDGVVFDPARDAHIQAKMAFMPPAASPRPAVYRSMASAAPFEDTLMSRTTKAADLSPTEFFTENDMTMPAFLDKPRRGDRESTLRWLARTQNLDGSWDGNVERTAAALLAFVRNGHTSRKGSYRQAVRRAFAWLETAQATGFAALARAMALYELADATGNDQLRLAVEKSLPQLGENPSPVEEIYLKRLQHGEPDKTPQWVMIGTLDELRTAAALGLDIPVAEDLLNGKDGDLVRAWWAALKK